MKKVKFFILFALLLLSLGACTTTPEETRPVTEVESSGALQEVAPPTLDKQLAEVEEEADLVEPTPEVVEDYPSPEPAVDDSAASYPAPEAAEAVVQEGYPEPEAEVADESTEELPEREAEAGPFSREVVIAAPDELGIVGTFNGDNSAGPQPGVLLLHMLGGTRNDWETIDFSTILNQNGYATLAIDLRGHGDSISAVDWALAEQDLTAVWEWFISQPEIDPTNSYVIGASIGSNLALRTAAAQPAVKASVLLSPGLNYRNVTTDDVIVNLDRPVLIVAMTDDTYSAESSAELELLNTQISTLAIQPGNAHGTRMFGVYDGLESLILEFLASN